jgi:hypothetical protein
MAQNKRKIGSTRIHLFFLAYFIFSILALMVFFDLEMFLNYFVDGEKQFHFSHRFLALIKVLLLFLWGIFSFLLAYTYLEAKFIGIFERLNILFQNMLKNPSLTLEFRQEDPFMEMADAFNRMRQTFLERIAGQEALIAQITSEFESHTMSPQKAREMIQKIDQKS